MSPLIQATVMSEDHVNRIEAAATGAAQKLERARFYRDRSVEKQQDQHPSFMTVVDNRLDDYRKDMEGMQGLIRSTNNEQKTVLKQMQEARLEIEEEKAQSIELRQTLSELRANLAAQVPSNADTKRELEAAVEVAKALKKDADAALEAANKTSREADKQLAVARALQTEITDQRTAFDRHQAQRLDGMQGSFATESTEIEQERREIESRTSRLVASEKLVRAQEAEVAAHKESLQVERDAFAAEKSVFQTTKDEWIIEYKATNAAYNQHFDLRKTEVEDKEAANERYSESLRQRETKETATRIRLTGGLKAEREAWAQSYTAGYNSLKEQKEDLEAREKALTEEMSGFDKYKSEIGEQFRQSQEQLEKYQSMVKDADKRLRQRFDAVPAAIKKFENRLATANDTVRDFKTEHSNLDGHIAEAKKHQRIASALLADTNSRLNRLKETREEMRQNDHKYVIEWSQELTDALQQPSDKVTDLLEKLNITDTTVTKLNETVRRTGEAYNVQHSARPLPGAQSLPKRTIYEVSSPSMGPSKRMAAAGRSNAISEPSSSTLTGSSQPGMQTVTEGAQITSAVNQLLANESRSRNIGDQIILPSNWTSDYSQKLLDEFDAFLQRKDAKNKPLEGFLDAGAKSKSYCLVEKLNRRKGLKVEDDVAERCEYCQSHNAPCIEVHHVQGQVGKKWELSLRQERQERQDESET